MPLIIPKPFRRLTQSLNFWTEVATDTPKFHFKLGDTGTPFLDDVSSGVESLSAQGTVLAQQTGQVEDQRGIVLNGTDGVISGTGTGVSTAFNLNIAGNTGTALEAVFYVDPYNSTMWIMGKGNAGVNSQQDNYTMRRLTNGTISFMFRGSNNVWYDFPSNFAAVPYKWHHVVINLVNNGSGFDVDIYLNGQLTTPTGTFPAYPWNVTGTPLNIGARYNTALGSNFSSYFKGTIDEVVGYEHELTASRIQAHFVATGIPIPIKTSGWNLPTATYDNISVGPNKTTGMQFTPDGTKFFSINNGIAAYPLSAAWDLSTVGSIIAVGGWPGNISSFRISDDGTRLILTGSLGNGTDTMNTYSLGTPWDMGTKSLISTINKPSVISVAYGIDVDDSGTILYVVAGANAGSSRNIYAFGLGVPWDLSTLNNTPIATIALNVIAPNATSIFMKDDGYAMYVGERGNAQTTSIIHEFDLATSTQLYTTTYNSVKYDAFVNEDDVMGIAFKPDGSKMYTAGQDADVGGFKQFSLA